MKTYYCTVWYDGDKTPFEFDYIQAESEELALRDFKAWYTKCYEHMPNFEGAIYEVEESKNENSK
ncbi:hypothetical protein GO755_32830 [Spirosoma sp. HMF4905]|uniref:Uncharacterized protein n=1 Tax=Spirosoma arboris TaxID=2682092 RepID=A0A7K1SM27_9BACT|nr:hypothetical protein [Spirosoma arboris]MVM34860.1 hypothetical protein [Spirosoma arboris]